MKYDLTDRSVIKQICEKHGFRLKKGLGQNFLTDRSVISDTVREAGIDKDTSVIEIGPGFGSLTAELLEAAGDVTSIELDSSLVPILQELFSDYSNFTLINDDVLSLDLNKLIKNDKTVVAANLPYYITTPIITNLLESKYPLKSITVMVQKEVADRMCASPGNKNYGALTCLINYFADARIIRIVPAESFFPPPKVDSAVVTLEILPEPRIKPMNEKIYFNVVKSVFLQRRKTLLNGLSNSSLLNIDKASLVEIFEELSLSPSVRGEQLSIFDFSAIADKIVMRTEEK